MNGTEQDVLAGVGPRLRALRRARGATLTDLARDTGLTPSTLSRLGHLRPTLEQLLPLARAHGVPLDDLVAAPQTGDPRVHLRPVQRAGLVFVPLTRRDQDLQLDVGEAAEFDTRVPHWIGSAGSEPAELLTLFGAQGERAHLSASHD